MKCECGRLQQVVGNTKLKRLKKAGFSICLKTDFDLQILKVQHLKIEPKMDLL